MHAVDFVLHLDTHLNEIAANYGIWIYVILFAIIFAETGLVVTPFLPGDSLLFVAGAIAAAGQIDVWSLGGTLFVAAILGNTSNYWIGRWLGPHVFKWDHSRWFNRHAFDEAHAFYEKYGAVAITVARFLPFVRTFAPFVAGVAAMSHHKFQFWSVLGGALWVVIFVALGYFFGNIPAVKNNIAVIMLAVVGISFLPLIYTWLVKRFKKPTAV
jgi:membrane-associated protein